ncbi:MAG: hypothetical protein ABH871_08710 [Pseudomonadota bacterium]
MRYLNINLFAALVLAVLVMCAQGVRAQSLSDFDWDGFTGVGTGQEVQTHTDPFSSGISAAEDLTVEDLQLTGIVYNNPNDAYALISGYLVQPGDLIAGYRVDAIEKDRVRLKRIDDVFILVLGGGI